MFATLLESGRPVLGPKCHRMTEAINKTHYAPTSKQQRCWLCCFSGIIITALDLYAGDYTLYFNILLLLDIHMDYSVLRNYICAKKYCI